MKSAATEVVQDHMQAAQTGDLDGIMAGYTNDALLFDSQGNSYRGHEAIRAIFSEVLGWSSELRPETEIYEAANVVFVTWKARRDRHLRHRRGTNSNPHRLFRLGRR